MEFEHYRSGTSHQQFRAMPASGLRREGLEEDRRPFDRSRYGEEIHAPIPLMETGEALNRSYPRCLDMPIRLPGQEWYHVPVEWQLLVPLIHRIVDLEHSNNASVLSYHTYLTVDSSTVQPEEQQRNGGLHVDGYQGARIDPKTLITRNYVATNNGGTRFYPQTFNVDLDDSRYNVFQAFDAQARDAHIAEENRVHFMDAYTVHESGLASREGLRTFLRVTFDVKRFDRLGNTHNSALNYDWPMVDRNVHDTLAPPP